jgi:hypothetical protein
VSCPELLEEIDTAVMNNDGSEEDSLRALSSIDFNDHRQIEDATIRDFLLIYLEEIMEIDVSAPYKAHINGRVYSGIDPNILYEVEDVKALVYFQQIVITKYNDIETNSDNWTLLLPTGLIPESSVDPVTPLLVPISSLVQLESIRRTHYSKS